MPFVRGKPAAVLVVALLCPFALAATGGPGEGGAEGERLTRGSRVGLDFRDQPVGKVAQAVGERAGKRVSVLGAVTKGLNPFQAGEPDASWQNRRVTLVSPEPVPFWDAVDRLAAAGKVRYRLTDFGDTGFGTTGVAFEGDGAAPGPACYPGPFRVGLVAVHEHREAIYVRAPWARFFPSGYQVPGDVDRDVQGEAPPDGGPLYAELRVLAEPGLVGRRDGPLRDLEAVDEAGRSLLAPAREVGPNRYRAFAVLSRVPAEVIRVPLKRAPGGGRTLRRLRGAIPVEVAEVRPRPALVIRLAGSEGKTFRAAGVAVTVKAAHVEPNGNLVVTLTGRFEGATDPALGNARIELLASHQWQLTDDRGGVPRSNSGSSGGGPDGGFLLSRTYTSQAGNHVPTEFRLYDLDRATWAVPFEFRDVPLP